MRFARLAVPAFGPFTDFALDLPRGDADLHLIFGPNEAGKSSLLRAVGDLLYGIHPRTADSFLHDNKDLRIAATLVGADGRRLAVQRRKGNKNTLLDADGAPRPDDALQGWLGVTDRAFFSTVFALDSDRLREGAESLLSGHGEIGQALFSASLAGTPVHRILSALEAEAATLFDGRKTKGVTIRPLIAAYKERLDASRDAAVRPEDWEQAVAAVAEAAADRDRLDEALRRKIARRDWVQRCLDALPVIGALGEQERLRADLPPSPDLGPPFVTQTEESLRARDAARTRMAALEGTIARLETRVDENRPDQRVLDRAGEIEALHQALAVQRQRRDDLAALQAEQASLSSELAAGMRALGVDGDPAAVEALRTGVAEELGLKEAAKALDEARAKAGQNRDSVDALQQERDGVEVKLAALPVSDPTQLRDALTRTEAAAQFARDLAELEVRAEQAARDCAACHELLPGAPADHAEACALAVPAVAVLRQFADEDGRIATELTSAERAADEAQARDRGLAGELDALERRGALPTEADLDRARVSRDALWTRVVALWRDGEPNDRPQDPPLDEAYPRSVRNADEIADRLRADADSVARAEHLRAQIRGASEDAARARQARAAAESARADWQARWLAAWEPCGLRPGTPEAMREWREHWMALRAAFGLRQSADANLARARSGIDRALALLRPLLPECADDDLLTLRAAAQGSVRDADQSRGAREQLEHRRHDLRADLDILDASFPALEQASADAGTVWRERCRRLGLPEDAATDTVLALLERRNALVLLYDRVCALGETLARKQRSVADDEASAHALADALDVAGGAVEARESALWQALADARERKARHDQARRDLEEEQARLPAARSELDAARRQLGEQLTRAGAADEDALNDLLERLQRHHAIDAEVERLRRTLHLPARGDPLDIFIERVRAEDANGLAAERDELDQAITVLQGERDQALRALHDAGARKTALEQSGADAAASLQQANNTAAGIRRDAARYLRLQLAVHLLRGQIERFRRESQGPLLARAGELFRLATGGSFDGLGTAFAGDDTPVLVGLRGETEVGVDGMSDGTRDQLFLALRIAAIDRHLGDHEPMPLVLDDLLMTFDDRRTLAILPVLQALADKTQILLFTHHRHLRDLARDALGDDGFHWHTLGSRDVPPSIATDSDDAPAAG